MKKLSRLLAKLGAVLLMFLGCGLYDVARNRGRDRSVVEQYFFGNGALTWLLSPLNVLLDLLTIPYRNKGVYRLEDLPRPHQDEIRRLIAAAHRENLVAQLEERTRDRDRSMIFFKWYGANVESGLDIPAFHEPYTYVQTIGVSVFNKRKSTSKHFGPLRATLRVLYNVNDMADDSAYITVGDVTSYWRTDKLFIFDDTLQHQSFNESDQVRYCLFVDILRPALSSRPLAAVVGLVRLLLKGANSVFYKNWDVLKG